MPIYNACINKCIKPEVEWYSMEAYRDWCNENENTPDNYHPETDYNSNLSRKKYYNEWINDMFDWYQKELRQYESCKASCWINPSMFSVDEQNIYLYSIQETEVNVILWTPEN